MRWRNTCGHLETALQLGPEDGNGALMSGSGVGDMSQVGVG